jgi:hypothetical protein
MLLYQILLSYPQKGIGTVVFGTCRLTGDGDPTTLLYTQAKT